MGKRYIEVRQTFGAQVEHLYICGTSAKRITNRLQERSERAAAESPRIKEGYYDLVLREEGRAADVDACIQVK